MPKNVASGKKGKDAAPAGASQAEVGPQDEWRQLTLSQQRRVVGALTCVSFHPVVGHPLYPRMAVVRLLPAADVDRSILVRDASSLDLLQHDLRSAFHWQSLLFFSADPEIREAVEALMSDHNKAVAWSWFDDDVWENPVWPVMLGQSPWRPNRVIELFRESVRELLRNCGAEEDPEAAPSFDRLEDVFSGVVRSVELSEVWDEASGALFPRRAVYVPPSFFGARARPFGEREERRMQELAEEVRVLEEEVAAADAGVVEGPVGGEVPAATSVPTSGGAAMEVGESGGAGGAEGVAEERRVRRSAYRKERRRRDAEERQAAREEDEREAKRVKEEEEEARAVLRLAAAKKKCNKEEAKRKRRQEESKRLKEEEEKKKKEEEDKRKREEEEEKRKAAGGRRPGKKWAPWWVVKEAKDAEKEVRRLEEEVGKARKLAAEKRLSLEKPPTPGSSVSPAPGPSGLVGVGRGRGGPRGSASVAVAPRGGRGSRGAFGGRGARPGLFTRGSFVRQPSTTNLPHSTPRPHFAPISYPPPRMHSPVVQPPTTPLAPTFAPAALDSSVLSLASSLTATLGEWARQHPGLLSALSGGGTPTSVAPLPGAASALVASPPVSAPVRYLAADYRVNDGSVAQVIDTVEAPRGGNDVAAPPPRR